MATYGEQFEYERILQERGAEAYYEAQDALRDKGRVEETDGMKAIFKHNNKQLIVALQAILEINVMKSPYKRRLHDWREFIDIPKLAYFAQYTVMRVLDGDNNDHLGVKYVCQRIGEMVETEARCVTFNHNNAAYYKTIVKSFDEDAVSNYEHKRKVMSAKMRDILGDLWEPWGIDMRVGIGSMLLRALLLVFKDMIYLELIWLSAAKSKWVLCTTVAFDEWLADFEHQRGMRTPYRMPMMVKPLPWVHGYKDGGYLSAALKYTTPFISPVGKAHDKFIQRFNPMQHMRVANKLQDVPYVINRKMFQLIEKLWTASHSSGIPSRQPVEHDEIPEYLAVMLDAGIELVGEDYTAFLAWKAHKKQTHREEIKRRALVRAFVNTINAARELVPWEEFYYVWTACFRGRLYPATSALQPQGHESARSMILFKNGKPLTASGMQWLAAIGGNLFGIKGDRTERAAWAYENTAFIKRCAETPLAVEWVDADKPLQFIAWCFEWEKCGYGTKPETLSHWIGGVDGTNNGLQHLSAMVRDPHGAFMTNLTSSAEKQDAYQVVADAMLRKLQELQDGVAELWQIAMPGRDLAKMPMMVLVYGATKQTCRKHCIDWVYKNKDRFDVQEEALYDIATYGANCLWEAIEEEIPEVIKLMQWLQANSSGRYVAFISHVGFPVYQYYMKAKMLPVMTQLAGTVSLACYDTDDDSAVPNNYKQRNGIVPNLVHSLDSAHLVMVVDAVEFEMSAVHDEYLAHCCNLDRLQQVTITKFHELHSTDVLAEWARQQGIDAQYLPKYGEWDVNEVLESQHLFE